MIRIDQTDKKRIESERYEKNKSNQLKTTDQRDINRLKLIDMERLDRQIGKD